MPFALTVGGDGNIERVGASAEALVPRGHRFVDAGLDSR